MVLVKYNQPSTETCPCPSHAPHIYSVAVYVVSWRLLLRVVSSADFINTIFSLNTLSFRLAF